MIECLQKAGAATSLVILDIFDALLTARRLDLARDMVIALRKRVRSYQNDDLLEWYHIFVAKLQQLFQLRNHGATLHLYLEYSIVEPEASFFLLPRAKK